MVSTTADGKVKLFTLLQDKPWNLSLKKHELTSPLIEFDFDDIEEASDHFKPLVRDLKYDNGECAIVTYLQAKTYGKQLSLLPFVVSGNYHHKSIAYNAEHRTLHPGDLTGKTVGVRTYSQTTGVWVRGVLQNEYGVDMDKVKFLVFDVAHLAEYSDPPNVSLAPKGKKLAQMLIEGDVDAAMLGGNMPKDDRLKTLIPNPDQAALEWTKKYGITPINHMYVVKTELVKSRPDVVKEIYRMLVKARETGPQLAPGAVNFTPNGIEANRKSLETVIKFAHQQRIIPKTFTVDELFEDTAKILDL